MRKKPPKKQQPNSAIPPQRRRRKTGGEARTSLQIVPKQETDIRTLFYSVFEETCGNISATCELLKIDRKTYYNWVSKDPEFAAKIAEIRADEKYIDVAEFSLLQKIRDGDVGAAIFTLKTKGKHRGWGERPPENSAEIDTAVRTVQYWLEDHPEATLEEKWKWLGRVADRVKVPVQELAKRVGVSAT